MFGHWSKRAVLAGVCSASGVTRLLQLLPRRDCLIVLNYHRIGDPLTTEYDRGVFSATADDFERQVKYLKKHFHVATLAEAQDFADQPARGRGTAVLFTFDDGYRDNYELALPVLRASDVQATFFLPTFFVGTNRIAWWDQIARVIRHSTRPCIRLSYPESTRLETSSPELRENAIRQVLHLYKSSANQCPERLLAELYDACGGTPPADSERLFMNWDEARLLIRGGMAIGSHTHTHPILAKLSLEQQCSEMRESREILERELGIRIDSLALPVGGRPTFSAETVAALRTTGYRTAFSFYGGINLSAQVDPYDIRRLSVELDTRLRVLALNVSGAAATGRLWFP